MIHRSTLPLHAKLDALQGALDRHGRARARLLWAVGLPVLVVVAIGALARLLAT